MSSATPSTSKPTDEKKTPEQAKDEEDIQPHLGVLEEDDEFEEFAVAGASPCTTGSVLRNATLTVLRSFFCRVDWDDSQTDLAHLGGATPGAAKSGGDKLWEDNWDDDDIEDEFSVQLR